MPLDARGVRGLDDLGGDVPDAAITDVDDPVEAVGVGARSASARVDHEVDERLLATGSAAGEQ
jgi:hypothetical protein